MFNCLIKFEGPCPLPEPDQLPRLGADQDVLRAAGGRTEPRVRPGPGQVPPAAAAAAQPGDDASKVQLVYCFKSDL